MKKKLLSIVTAMLMLLALLPGSAEAAGEFACVWKPLSSDSMVLTVTSHRSVKAYAEYDTQAEVAVEHNVVTVSACPGFVGIANVFITVNGSVHTMQVPLGYTVFSFRDKSITVYEGSSDKYEITGLKLSGEELTSAAEGLIVDDDGAGNTVYANDNDYRLNVNIKKKGGTFVFTGVGDDMSVSVNKESTGDAVLLLAGLQLSSSFTAPITVRKDSAAKVEITALGGTENVLTDSEKNNADTYAENPCAESAVIKGKTAAKLTLNGTGALTLNANAKNAVKVGEKGSLTVQDLDLTVNSAGHGLSSDNELTVLSGRLTVKASGDALRSDPDTVDASGGTAGVVTVRGGSLSINVKEDAIQAAAKVKIDGGTFSFLTMGGRGCKSFYPDTMSAKGIKASRPEGDETTENSIVITGGTFSMNTADDAIHSDGTVSVTGGAFYILAGDDAVHADREVHIGSENADSIYPVINIAGCCEGLEGSDVFIHSGTVKIVSTDDGINAAGGADGSGGEQGQFGPFHPGPPIPGNNRIVVSGGDLYVNANGDGLDSNGSLTVSGGRCVIWGQAAGGDNSPLDCDGELTITGGMVFGAGSRQMAETPKTGPYQQVLEFGTSGSMGRPGKGSLSASIDEGSIIRVLNGSTVEFAAKALKKVNYVIYSWSGDSSEGWSIGSDTVTEPTYPYPCSHIPDLTQEITVRNEPTCTEEGSGDVPCLLCRESVKLVLPALNCCEAHFSAKEPTCEEAGHSAYTVCVRCGEVRGYEETKAGHTMVLQVTLAPTEWREGTLLVYCSGCGISKEVRLPRLDGESYSFDESVSEYRWLNTTYGTVQFPLYGDVDGSGWFTLQDVSLLFRWWNGKQELSPQAVARGDADGNGVTDLRDAAALYLANITKG